MITRNFADPGLRAALGSSPPLEKMKMNGQKIIDGLNEVLAGIKEQEKWTRVEKFIKNGDYYVAHCGTEKDAETIFRAVNCHDELVGALEFADEILRENTSINTNSIVRARIEKVLARAKASHGAGT